MFIILKGTYFQGAVAFTAHGLFNDEESAVNWGVKNLEGEPEWFPLEVKGTDELLGIGAEDDLDTVTEEQLAQYIKDHEAKRLPREIMVDLSGI